MATKYIGRRQFSRYPFLSGIDDLGGGGYRRDLPHMPLFHRVTKHDPPWGFMSGWR
jgi:hypothetical protein